MLIAITVDSSLGQQAPFVILFVLLLVLGASVTTATLIRTARHFRQLRINQDQERRPEDG